MLLFSLSLLLLLLVILLMSLECEVLLKLLLLLLLIYKVGSYGYVTGEYLFIKIEICWIVSDDADNFVSYYKHSLT